MMKNTIKNVQNALWGWSDYTDISIPSMVNKNGSQWAGTAAVANTLGWIKT